MLWFKTRSGLTTPSSATAEHGVVRPLRVLHRSMKSLASRSCESSSIPTSCFHRCFRGEEPPSASSRDLVRRSFNPSFRHHSAWSMRMSFAAPDCFRPTPRRTSATSSTTSCHSALSAGFTFSGGHICPTRKTIQCWSWLWRAVRLSSSPTTPATFGARTLSGFGR